MIKPEDLAEPGSAPADKALLVFTRHAFRAARELLQSAEKVKTPAPCWNALLGEFKKVKVCVVGLHVGAPASVLALELLIAGGAETFIAVGEAGAVHPSARIGDVLLPSWGLREEGTSYHYVPPDHVPKPSTELFEALRSKVEELKSGKMKLLVGGVWSTDAPFRETRDKVREYAARGVVGVDMESTALMCVAEYRGVELAVALAISDELHGVKWKPGFNASELETAEALLVKAALAALTEK